jgi:hypothetical protein
MPEALPFFLAWLITWLALMAYLWRLENALASDGAGSNRPEE